MNGEIFYQNNAEQLINFANENKWIGRLSIWYADF